MPPNFFSIVVPTYNRSDVVAEALRSAMRFAELGATEVLLVDDGSTDDTLARVKQEFHATLDSGALRLICLPQNVGVTAAKNAGVGAASGEWIVFLDSDDILTSNARRDIEQAIRSKPDVDLFFFRCADSRGGLVGETQETQEPVTVPGYLGDWRWGECLPVARRSTMCRFRYDGELRGFEGLTYARIMKAGRLAIVHPAVVRVYSTDSTDRLCAPRGLAKRSCEAAIGYSRLVREFWRELGVLRSVRLCISIVANALRCAKLRASG